MYFWADINECNDPRACGFSQRCINTDGSYRCECLPGHKPDPRARIEVDTYYHCTGKHIIVVMCTLATSSYYLAIIILLQFVSSFANYYTCMHPIFGL